jgi:hypothetical protein
MGGLIKTKGTKLLAAHFNDEFDTYFRSFWRPLQLATPNGIFNTAGGNVDLRAITLAITDATAGHSHRGDNLVLLPNIHNHPVHVHLENRWLWYLDVGNVANGSLTQANHNKIADGIYHGLTDHVVVSGAPVYTWDCVVFDAVESGLTQDVAIAGHHEDGRHVMEITLITPPIPKDGIVGSLDPLDDPNNH